MKKSMSKYILLTIAFFTSLASYAVIRSHHLVVTSDENGEPLPYASYRLSNIGEGVTDAFGHANFNLNDTMPSDGKLTIRSFNHKSVNIPFGSIFSSDTVKARLSPEYRELSPVEVLPLPPGVQKTIGRKRKGKTTGMIVLANKDKLSDKLDSIGWVHLTPQLRYLMGMKIHAKKNKVNVLREIGLNAIETDSMINELIFRVSIYDSDTFDPETLETQYAYPPFYISLKKHPDPEKSYLAKIDPPLRLPKNTDIILRMVDFSDISDNDTLKVLLRGNRKGVLYNRETPTPRHDYVKFLGIGGPSVFYWTYSEHDMPADK